MTKLAIAACVLLLGAALAAAQDPAITAPGERGRTYLVLRIVEALELGDEQARDLSRILATSGERRAELFVERKTLGQSLRSALDQNDEPRIAELIARSREIDRESLLLPLESFTATDAILSLEERAKLVLLLPELRRQVRRAAPSQASAP